MVGHGPLAEPPVRLALEMQQRSEVDVPGITGQQRDQVLDLVAGAFDVLAEELAVEHQDACDLGFFIEGPGSLDDLRNAGGISSGGKLALIEKALELVFDQA